MPIDKFDDCVCPGPVDTAWTHKETGAVDEETEKALITATPFGRRGTAEEVANVYAFLASDAASFVTGAGWTVDGGLTTADSQTSPSIRWHTEQGGAQDSIGASIR